MVSDPVPPTRGASHASTQPKQEPNCPTASASPSSEATAADLNLLHHNSSLSFVFVRPVTDDPPKWLCRGETVLYVVDEAEKHNSSLALHLRGSCRILNVKAESVAESKDGSQRDPAVHLETLPVSYQHCDPLAHVLIKPAQSYTEADLASCRYDADSQCCRGGVGMTTGLRAASVASDMGELRLHVSTKGRLNPKLKDKVQECWKADIENLKSNQDGKAVERLKDQLYKRSSGRREDRINLVAQRLTHASCDNNHKEKKTASATTFHGRAIKLTIQYEIEQESPTSSDMGGIHFRGTTTPHVYTTSGLIGDHEGPRSWIPCLDSASYRHRASRELVVKVTATMREGLSSVGCGEDFGSSETLLHDFVFHESVEQELGEDQCALIRTSFREAVDSTLGETAIESVPHVIPPDKPAATIDSILATSIWCSTIWAPIPARSMGFVVAPLKSLYDPEYYCHGEDSESEGGDKVEGHSIVAEAAKAKGEGIRQMYFAPLYERKHIHAKATMSLLPNTEIYMSPLSPQQIEKSEDIEVTIAANTSGVTNRALSLMRDILALPAYRTVSYTQIWIPDAVHGGSTSGALHCCPEVLVNPFLGGSIMDSRLLPPVGGFRLPYYNGGRVLQFLQARCAVRGWIVAALPLGGNDDVGFGYIHTLFESFIMSLYDRAHGAHGEGGASDSVFFTKRYAVDSGLNSKNLDFLPIPNIEEEELDMVVGGVVGAVPIEDRNTDQLWRSPSNGTESHTSATDEFALRQVLTKDIVDAFERGTDRDKNVPLPGFGWLGSYLSVTFLSSNSASSSALGCGALELVHPVGGLAYRISKCELLRRIVEGRAGMANFARVIRAAFVAAHIEDRGGTELKLPSEKDKGQKEGQNKKTPSEETQLQEMLPRFGLCVDELVKKHGLTHTLFVVALRKLAGHREPHLRGTLVDVERENRDPRTHRQNVEPEGFPNSYVRGASELYLRVGTHVEPSGAEGGGSTSQAAASAGRRFQLHVFAEPIIPEGGIAFGGPVTLRVVENEGQNHFVVRTLKSDGSRCDWGPISLHTTKPVTTARQQTAASGAIDGVAGSATLKDSGGSSVSSSQEKSLLCGGDGIFNSSILHGGGYQAIELIRLTNRTPLLWVRADPQGLYGGRISVFQPDACLAEQLFHDGDAGAQIDAIRALAERPLQIQGSAKVTTVYDVNVSELPVRVLGDCLRGSPALHSSLPHTSAVRVQAALAIAQWQNNKAPTAVEAVGADSWIGLNLLMQYFNERYFSNGIVLPVKFTRLSLKKSEAEVRQKNAVEGGSSNNTSGADDGYQYVDAIDDSEKADQLKQAVELEIEEDEEYRVRSAVLTAIACVRAKDGTTPSAVLRFMENVLVSGNVSNVGNIVSPDEEVMIRKKRKATHSTDIEKSPETDGGVDSHNVGNAAELSYMPSLLIADALLALCHLNVRPALVVSPVTGKPVQSKARHPVLPLMEASHQWLEWELYREAIRMEAEEGTMTGIGEGCHSPIAACAVTALYSLAILRQSTTDPPDELDKTDLADKSTGASDSGTKRKPAIGEKLSAAVSSFVRGQSFGDCSFLPSHNPPALENLFTKATSQFYISIFDEVPHRSDVTRAACAQAVACICCAADRFENNSPEPLGLLTALEFLLERILDTRSSPGLRQALALLMTDSCTGKVCSMQRVGTVGGRSDLCMSGARFMTGPLGASHGGDNGSAVLMTVTQNSYPAASAVNDGARRGLRLLTRAGHPHDTTGRDQVVVRVAKFATLLWRTINGDHVPPACGSTEDTLRNCEGLGLDGVCSNDGILRCTLLALWQWIWPKGCFAVLRVQSWRSHEGTQRYKDLGANQVMKITDEEKKFSLAEETMLADLNKMVSTELDRQLWRGEMAATAYKHYKTDKKALPLVNDTGSTEQGVGQPLPPVQRDNAFKQGGWIASAAQQRRAMTLDGGSAVTKIRLTLKSSSGAGE